MVWPVLVLTGFLVLMALVIVLGTRSTRLYEAERHASPVAAWAAGGAEPAADGRIAADGITPRSGLRAGTVSEPPGGEHRATQTAVDQH